MATEETSSGGRLTEAEEGQPDERLPREVTFAAAMSLSPSAKEDLFDILLGDAEVEPDPEIEAACVEELDRRLRDADEGRVEWVPAEEVLADLRRRLSEPRPEPARLRVGEREVRVPQLFGACRALPLEDRVDLAGRLLSSLAEERDAGIDAAWLRASERQLIRARQILASPAASSAEEDAEDLADARAAREEAEREGTIPWERAKDELGLK